MNEQDIKTAFEEVHTEQKLKASVQSQLHDRLYGNTAPHCITRAAAHSFFLKRAALFCICILIGTFGYRSYTTTAAVISLDINPSLELKINRYNRVIGVSGYNSAGSEIAGSLDLLHQNYVRAVELLLDSEAIRRYLTVDNTLEIAVASKDTLAADKICANLSGQSGISAENIHTCSWKDASDAHNSGMSCGRYRVLTQLQEENPDLSIDDIKDLPMAELHSMQDACGSEHHQTTPPDNETESGSKYDNSTTGNPGKHHNDNQGGHHRNRH